MDKVRTSVPSVFCGIESSKGVVVVQFTTAEVDVDFICNIGFRVPIALLVIEDTL